MSANDAGKNGQIGKYVGKSFTWLAYVQPNAGSLFAEMQRCHRKQNNLRFFMKTNVLRFIFFVIFIFKWQTKTSHV